MNVQQLRYLCCVADAGFSISAAARRLGTSQPAVSQQLRALEKRLGIDLVLRHGNRIQGFTAAGSAVHATAMRTLREVDNLQRISADFKQRGAGRLVVATTHIAARYILGPPIKEFLRGNAAVQFELRQGTPAQIADWVIAGEADMGVGTLPTQLREEIVYLRCTELPRVLIAPVGHKLLRERKLTLAAILAHPFIAMDLTYSGGQTVAEAFAAAGLEPKPVVTAIDPDVIKWYVELGLGVAAIPLVAYDARRDRRLRAMDASHLFESTVAHVELRRGAYLSNQMLRLITLIAPQWSRDDVARAMSV